MLADISNQPAQHPLAAPSSPASKAPNKRSLALALSSEGDAVLPTQLRIKRQFSSTSSSSPAPGAGSSSPFFQRSHLDTFYAPTSPTSSTYEKHPLSPVRPAPSNACTSLPPSSPSFGLSSATALDKLVKVSSVLASEAPAASAEQKSDPGLEAPRVVHLERDTVLYFGRKAKKALPRSPLQHGANRLTHVPIMLPKSAKNASRIHCSARIVSAPSSSPRVQVEIRVTGQNGMKVDGKVRRDGSVVRLEKRAGESVKLRFWGWDAQLVVAESEAEMRSEEGSDGELGDLPSEVEEEEVDTSTCSKRRSRPASRAASPALSFYSDDHGLSPQQRPTHLPTSSPLSPPPSLPSFTPSASSARAASLTRSLNLDLPGLVASSIVFHSRSTVAVDEIIHALLRETGSMWDVLSDQVEELKDTEEGERRAVEAWRGEVETVLDEEEMFGKIDNTGLKDASGHPLPPYYFYIPDSDPSPDRVAALEPFVKRVRGARTKKQARYFWAKPSLRRNR
ncbi:hypothetical protein JCM10049v2_001400 [Rhodotorula toruloides]